MGVIFFVVQPRGTVIKAVKPVGSRSMMSGMVVFISMGGCSMSLGFLACFYTGGRKGAVRSGTSGEALSSPGFGM